MSNENNQTLTEETKQLLYRYLNASQNLYGVVPLRTILRIYNSQNEPISEEAFLKFIDNIDFEDKHYDVITKDELFDVPPEEAIDSYLVSEYLLMDSDYEQLYDVLTEQMGKPYYVPNQKKFLKYEDEYYFEKTNDYISLRAFLRNLPSLTKKKADDIAEEIQLLMFIDDYDVDFCLYTAERMGAKLDEENLINEFIGLCSKLAANSRKHIHCGHTAIELFIGM